jgi:membrane protein implicated in regulation of membrane protease activity
VDTVLWIIAGLVLVLAIGFILMKTASPRLRMNADALPGQRAVALTELVLGGNGGRVRMRAMEWLAVPTDHHIIPAGANVRIVAINGITLVVRAEES